MAQVANTAQGGGTARTNKKLQPNVLRRVMTQKTSYSEIMPQLPAPAASSGQDLQQAIQAAQRGETVRPAEWAQYESGIDAWNKEVEQTVSQAVRDSEARDGVWQDPGIYEDYRRQQDESIEGLQNRSMQLRAFFDTHRDVYGSDQVDKLLSAMDQNGKRLSGVKTFLDEEGTFRGQFADEAEYNEYTRLSAYEKLRSSPDFAEKSRYSSTANGKRASYDPYSRQYTQTGYDDPLYDYINRDPTAMTVLATNEINNGSAAMGRGSAPYEFMDDSQTALFNYLYATKGKDSAYDYLSLLRSNLNAKQRTQLQQDAAEFAQKYKGLASAASILASPARGLAYIGQAADYIGDGKIDPNAGYNRYSYIPSTIRAQRSQDIAEGWAGDVGSFVYNTGMSMGDFLLNAAITGGGSAGLGLMGAGAAADTVLDKKAQGYDDTRSLVLGTVAGLAEVATEKFSLDALLDKTSLGRSAFGYFMKNVIAEGSEEGASDLINWAADELYDVITSQSDSEWKRAVREKGTKAAFWDRAKELGLDVLGGAMSGGVMSGANIAANRLLYRNAAPQTDTRSPAPVQDLTAPAPVQDITAPDPLAQTAREMAMEAMQEPAEAPAAPAMQEPAPAQQGPSEATQRSGGPYSGYSLDELFAQLPDSDPSAPLGMAVDTMDTMGQQRTATDTTGQQRTAADTMEQQAAMQTAAALVQAAQDFGQTGRQAFAEAWDGRDSAQYYAGFAAWYRAGLEGKAVDQVRSPYAGNISAEGRQIAYNAGQMDAALSLEQEKAAAPYAKSAGAEAGLRYADNVQAAIDAGETVFTPEQVDRIEAAARAFGVNVYVVDSIEQSRANGKYSGSDILLARDAENPLQQVLGHELTHRLQELAPEQFRTFRQAALDNMADSAVQAKLERYRAQGESLQYEQAMNDVAADYAGRLLEDGQLLDQFIERHREDRTLLQKLRDVFRSLWEKLTGAERRRAQSAEGKLSAVLDAAATQAQNLIEAPEGQATEGKALYSLKEYDGKDLSKDGSVYTYDFLTSLPDMKVTTLPEVDAVRDSNGKVDTRAVLDMGMKNARAVGTERDGKIFVRNGYTGHDLRIDVSSIRHGLNGGLNRLLTNARLGAVIGELVQDAVPINALQDKAQGVSGTYAMAGYATDSAGREFVAIVTVEQRTGNVNGLEVYDVTHAVSGRQKRSERVDTKSQGVYPSTNASEISIADFLEAVKGTHQSILSQDVLDRFGEVRNPGGYYADKAQYSLKDTTITKTYNQLLRENDALRERVDYWRGQSKTTKEVTTDKKSVTAAAKALVKEYGAQLDAGELAGRLQALYDHMARTLYDKGETEGSDVWKGAEEIARDIAESSVAEWSLADEFPGLRERLRDTSITVGHEYDGDIRNENFRREYRGKLKLSAEGPTNVDAMYAELSESYPGLFPADITHPADQLEQIMEVADSLATVEQQRRFSGQMDEAVMGITNEIMEGFFDLPQTRATMADRYEAKLDALRAENKQAVQQAIAKERETRQRQIKAIKDRRAQSRKDAKARRADSEARDRLLHIAKRLQNKKLPEVNRALLNEYIGDLDTIAKSMTGQTLAKLESLRDWYSEQKSGNPDFLADPKIERDLQRLSKRQIADLSAQEVADLTQVLQNIENEMRTQRKLIDSQERRDVYAAGESAIRDIEASAGSKPTGLWSIIDKHFITETLSPLRQVRRMTGYAPDSPLTSVTQELADGQRAMMDYQMKAEAQFSRYTNDKGFTKSFAGPKAKGIQIQGIGKDGPTTVTITPAMRASLYLHSLNDQNLRHIRDGGITVPDRKLYQKGQIAEAYARGTTVRLTPTQVRSITANMTQKERAFARAAHQYFNSTSKRAINAVSEKLKGYSIAQVENYFPIHTDSSFTRADFDSIKHDGTIEGMGFLKERVNAANPILLRDMSAELDQSIQMHSKYVGMAIPVRNFNKLWNVTTGQWVDIGDGTGYTGAKGGGTDGLEEAAGYNRRGEAGEGLYADAGGAGADASVSGGIAEWAANAQIERPEGIAREAVKNVRSYGVRAVVVQDAAIKSRNPNAMALTEGGVVYLSDALTGEDASVSHHEAVHAVKQRGSAAYESFLDSVGGELNLHSQTADYVLKVITNSRFDGQDLLDLTPAQQRTVFDELNAVVWGCYKADAKNARAQFRDVFTDFGGYITALSGIMEAEKTKAQASRRFQYEDSVKSAVKNKWGETGYDYIEKMMSDLQNGHKPTKAWSKAMSKLRSNYAGAVLTLNGSVAMKQAASYPTAAAVLGWGPLNRAMLDVGKVDLDLIAKYTPLQWYRSKGFSTQELGDMASRNKQLPKVLNWVQGVDLITTRKLWKASEYYVRAHNDTLERGTDAYYKAVADIYNQVIEETQPNYTTMQRPQLLRSDDSLLANMQMFKTQPFQNFNIVYDAAGEFVASMRRGDKGQIKASRAKVGRAVTSQLAQLAVFAGMGMAWAVLRGKKKKYEDEEGELTLQSALSALGKDMAGGALAGIPFGSDAWELVSSKMFGDSYYGMDAVTVQALSDTLKSLDGMGELIEGTVRSALAGDAIDWRSSGIKLDGYIDDISKAAGVPWENIANLVHAIHRQVCVASLGELQGEYAAMKWTVDPSKKSGEYYDLLYKALERGDLDSYFTIRDELPELLGRENSDIDSAMTDRYEANLKKDPGYTLSERAYDLLGIRPKLDNTKKEPAFSPDSLDAKTYQSFQEQRADRWRSAAAQLEGSALYGKLSDADKDKAMNAAWEYAHQTALAEASGGKYKPTSEWIGKAKEAAKRGVQPWEYTLYKTAYGTDAAYKALEKGNLSEYKTLRGKYMDVLGNDGPSIDEAMRDKYKEKGGALPQTAMDLIGIHPTGSGSGDDSDSFGADDLERAAYDAYTTQRATDYRAMIDRVTSDPIYQAAMEKVQSDALADMYTIADKNALVSASDGRYKIPQNYNWIDKARGLEDYGLDSADYVLYRLALRMADEANAENSKVGSYTNDEVKTALSQLDIPMEAKSYLWLAQGKNANTNPYK